GRAAKRRSNRAPASESSPGLAPGRGGAADAPIRSYSVSHRFAASAGGSDAPPAAKASRSLSIALRDSPARCSAFGPSWAARESSPARAPADPTGGTAEPKRPQRAATHNVRND